MLVACGLWLQSSRWLVERVGLGFYCFVLLDEAKAFFTAVVIFDQLQDSESSAQCCGGFGLSRLAATEVGFAGVSTIGGPTD